MVEQLAHEVAAAVVEAGDLSGIVHRVLGYALDQLERLIRASIVCVLAADCKRAEAKRTDTERHDVRAGEPAGQSISDRPILEHATRDTSAPPPATKKIAAVVGFVPLNHTPKITRSSSRRRAGSAISSIAVIRSPLVVKR